MLCLETKNILQVNIKLADILKACENHALESGRSSEHTNEQQVVTRFIYSEPSKQCALFTLIVGL